MFRWLSASDLVLPALPAWPAGLAPQRAEFSALVEALVRESPAIHVEPPRDAVFVAVPPAVLDAAIAWTLRFEAALGLRYTPESWDCDDFALELDRTLSRILARAGLAAAPLTGTLDAALVWEWAGAQPGPTHELALCQTTEGLTVIEPQNGRKILFAAYPNRGSCIAAGGF